MEVAPLDIVFGIVIVFMAFRVAIRGFVSEVMAFASVFAGIALAIIFSGALSVMLDRYLGESFWNPVIAFLAIFLAVYFIVKVIENALHGMLDHVNLEKLDRALGFFLGIAEGIVFCALAVFLLELQPFWEVEGLLRSSLFVRILLPLLPFLPETLSEVSAPHV